MLTDKGPGVPMLSKDTYIPLKGSVSRLMVTGRAFAVTLKKLKNKLENI